MFCDALPGIWVYWIGSVTMKKFILDTDKRKGGMNVLNDFLIIIFFCRNNGGHYICFTHCVNTQALWLAQQLIFWNSGPSWNWWKCASISIPRTDFEILYVFQVRRFRYLLQCACLIFKNISCKTFYSSKPCRVEYI